DRHGNARLYAYDDEDGDLIDDELISITDHVGRTTTLAYTGGLVTSITDFAGAVTEYAYTGGRVTAITSPDPDGMGPGQASVMSYQYDGTTGLLTRIVDPNGLATEIAYDTARRVSSMQLACGGTTELDSLYSQAVVDLTQIGYDDQNLAP